MHVIATVDDGQVSRSEHKEQRLTPLQARIYSKEAKQELLQLNGVKTGANK